jgi:hypothetical protein
MGLLLAHVQPVFGIDVFVRAARQSKRFAKHDRVDPVIFFRSCPVAFGRVPRDVAIESSGRGSTGGLWCRYSHPQGNEQGQQSTSSWISPFLRAAWVCGEIARKPRGPHTLSDEFRQEKVSNPCLFRSVTWGPQRPVVGSPGPMTLRPRLTTGLPLSRNRGYSPLCRRELGSVTREQSS